MASTPKPRHPLIVAASVAVLVACPIAIQAQEDAFRVVDPPPALLDARGDPAANSDGYGLDQRGGMASALGSPASGDSLRAAEVDYRAGHLDTALERFGMVAAMQDHPFAWLRIGNIRHRRGESGPAFDAYTRAAAGAVDTARFGTLRDRATMNLALLGLDQAQRAVERLGSAANASPSRQWQDEVLTRLQELREALPGADPGRSRAVVDSVPRGPDMDRRMADVLPRPVERAVDNARTSRVLR